MFVLHGPGGLFQPSWDSERFAHLLWVGVFFVPFRANPFPKPFRLVSIKHAA